MSGETVIVVPCYNEAARLDLAAFGAFLEHSRGVSLLLVDDGSTDGTPHVLEKLRARQPEKVAVLGLGENVGKAEAVRRGVKLALRRGPSMVGYWDADLATPLDAIHAFRTVLVEQPNLELVMGSRVALLGRKIRRSWKRHLLGRAFATAASMVLGLSVYDTQCGAKLFRVTRQTAALFDRPFRARWIFDVELLARMLAAAESDGDAALEELIYEYPLERWQDVAGSRLKSHDFFVAISDLAAIRWQYLSGKRARAVVSPAYVPQPARRDAA
jgi:glycosyltransferase involved in cell wall biosynthesis